MSVTAIIPTYNRAHLLGETLESLFAQTRPVDEIILIDDGSTDGTAEFIEQYQDRLKYVWKENGGKSAALNHALKLSKGRLIWICDDDDILTPKACERLAGCLEADPDLGFACGRHNDFTIDPESGQKIFKPAGIDFASKDGAIFSDLLERCHIFQPGLMVRKSVYDDVGSFREDLIRSQDYEMIVRIARHHRGKMLDEILFHYREHSGQRGSAKMRFDWNNRFKVWRSFADSIWRPLIQDLDNSELLPDGAPETPSDPERLSRARSLKRATICGMHGLWDEAVEVWAETAIKSVPNLTQFERQLTRRSTLVMCEELLNRADLRARLKHMGKSSDLGREIKYEIDRSLFWRARQAAKTRQMQTLFLILRFVESRQLLQSAAKQEKIA